MFKDIFKYIPLPAIIGMIVLFCIIPFDYTHAVEYYVADVVAGV